jgi:hypothetical protein
MGHFRRHLAPRMANRIARKHGSYDAGVEGAFNHSNGGGSRGRCVTSHGST